MRAWVTCWESEKRKTSEVKRENNTEIVETKVFFFSLINLLLNFFI